MEIKKMREQTWNIIEIIDVDFKKTLHLKLMRRLVELKLKQKKEPEMRNFISRLL